MEQRKLKANMVEQGLTQKDIAKTLGITTRAVNYKINGEREFSLSEAFKIANLFDKQIEDIFLK